MTTLEDLNDMCKDKNVDMSKHAEMAAQYGLAMLDYHNMFYGIKVYVNLSEQAEGKPLTEWKRSKGSRTIYDSEREITEKFKKFCEERKRPLDRHKREQMTKALLHCCEARHELLHRSPEKACEKFLNKMLESGKGLTGADYYKELTESIRNPLKVLTETPLQFREFMILLNAQK